MPWAELRGSRLTAGGDTAEAGEVLAEALRRIARIELGDRPERAARLAQAAGSKRPIRSERRLLQRELIEWRVGELIEALRRSARVAARESVEALERGQRVLAGPDERLQVARGLTVNLLDPVERARRQLAYRLFLGYNPNDCMYICGHILSVETLSEVGKNVCHMYCLYLGHNNTPAPNLENFLQFVSTHSYW